MSEMNNELVIEECEFEFPIDLDEEAILYSKVFIDQYERCGCIKVHYDDGIMEVVDFKDDPTTFKPDKGFFITWHTSPTEDFPEPHEIDLKYMLENEIDYQLILGRKGYVIIMKDDNNKFKMKRVEWDLINMDPYL